MIRNDNERHILERLRGTTVALATPLDNDGRLDVEGLHRLIDRVLRDGAAGVFALGWMGEQPALPTAVRRQVMEKTAQFVGGRAPVIVGISEQSLPRAMEEAGAARAAGADVVLAAAPFACPLPQRLLVEFFRELAGEGPLPLIVYNNAETHVLLEPETVRSISQVPGIIGMKDYSDFVQLQRRLQTYSDEGQFIVWVADEYVLGPALLLGARHSLLGGPGNVMPRWGSQLHELALAGKWPELSALHRKMVAFCDALYATSESAYSSIKAALAVLGFGSGKAVPPLPTLNPAQVAQVRRVLDEYGVSAD